MPRNALPDPLTVLRRAWPLVIVGGVLGAAATGGGAALLPKHYMSAAVVRVVTPSATSGPLSTAGNEDPARVVATQRAAVLSDGVVGRTATALRVSPDVVRGQVTVTADTVADTLTVSATAATPDAAQALARSVTDAYVGSTRSAGQDALSAQIRDNETQLAALRARITDAALPPFQRQAAATQYEDLARTQASVTSARDGYQGLASVIAQARLPLGPSSLGPSKAATIGLVLGLLAASALALVRSARRERLTWVSDIVATAGLPLLAEVPFSKRLVGAPGRLAVLPDEDPGVLEAARGLAVTLTSGRHMQAVLITSTGRYDGKSSVAGQLAVACARSGLRTILIAADVRAPAALPLPAGALGLTDLLGQEQTPDHGVLRAARQETGTPNLTVVGPGTALAAGADLLRGPRLRPLLVAMAAEADVLVVDGPAVSVPESATLAAACDTVVLCVGTHDARRTVIADTMTGLRAIGGEPLGLVVVDVEDRIRPEHSDYQVEKAAAARAARAAQTVAPESAGTTMSRRARRAAARRRAAGTPSTPARTPASTPARSPARPTPGPLLTVPLSSPAPVGVASEPAPPPHPGPPAALPVEDEPATVALELPQLAPAGEPDAEAVGSRAQGPSERREGPAEAGSEEEDTAPTYPTYPSSPSYPSPPSSYARSSAAPAEQQATFSREGV